MLMFTSTSRTLRFPAVVYCLRIILAFYQAAESTCGVEFLNWVVPALRFEICFHLYTVEHWRSNKQIALSLVVSSSRCIKPEPS